MQKLFFCISSCRFGQAVLPAKFDIYANLRVYVQDVGGDGSVTVGFYFDIKSLDCVRDPLYIPQARCPPGVPLPHKIESRPHPYGK